MRIVPADPDRWDELATFFGPSGAYSHCWCTWFRQSGAAFDTGCRDGGAGNREFLHRLVGEGRQPGLIGYRGATPVGWVSVGPREHFGRILRSRQLRPDPDDPVSGVWSVVCFWVPRANRRQGVAAELLAGAVEHATSGGAGIVEGYPVDTTQRHPAAAALYTGSVRMFLSAGFAVARRRAPARPVVQLVAPV